MSGQWSVMRACARVHMCVRARAFVGGGMVRMCVCACAHARRRFVIIVISCFMCGVVLVVLGVLLVVCMRSVTFDMSVLTCLLRQLCCAGALYIKVAICMESSCRAGAN